MYSVSLYRILDMIISDQMQFVLVTFMTDLNLENPPLSTVPH